MSDILAFMHSNEAPDARTAMRHMMSHQLDFVQYHDAWMPQEVKCYTGEDGQPGAPNTWYFDVPCCCDAVYGVRVTGPILSVHLALPDRLPTFVWRAPVDARGLDDVHHRVICIPDSVCISPLRLGMTHMRLAVAVGIGSGRGSGSSIPTVTAVHVLYASREYRHRECKPVIMGYEPRAELWDPAAQALKPLDSCSPRRAHSSPQK
jgi:hypothetical protein